MRRCVDHQRFWQGNVTHIKTKKQLKQYKVLDQKTMAFIFHEKICPQCMFAKPLFGLLADSGMVDMPDVTFVAIDCAKMEKTCVNIKPPIREVPELRFYGDIDDWKKGGTVLAPVAMTGLAHLKKASDDFDDALFAYDGGSEL